MKRNKEQQIVWDIYRALYRHSTPPADFDELVDNATCDEMGNKEIDFMAYEIENEMFEKWMDIELEKHELSQCRKNAIRTTVYLGCSPKYKMDE